MLVLTVCSSSAINVFPLSIHFIDVSLFEPVLAKIHSSSHTVHVTFSVYFQVAATHLWSVSGSGVAVFWPSPHPTPSATPSVPSPTIDTAPGPAPVPASPAPDPGPAPVPASPAPDPGPAPVPASPARDPSMVQVLTTLDQLRTRVDLLQTQYQVIRLAAGYILLVLL